MDLVDLFFPFLTYDIAPGVRVPALDRSRRAFEAMIFVATLACHWNDADSGIDPTIQPSFIDRIVATLEGILAWIPCLIRIDLNVLSLNPAFSHLDLNEQITQTHISYAQTFIWLVTIHPKVEEHISTSAAALELVLNIWHSRLDLPQGRMPICEFTTEGPCTILDMLRTWVRNRQRLDWLLDTVTMNMALLKLFVESTLDRARLAQEHSATGVPHMIGEALMYLSTLFQVTNFLIMDERVHTYFVGEEYVRVMGDAFEAAARKSIRFRMHIPLPVIFRDYWLLAVAHSHGAAAAFRDLSTRLFSVSLDCISDLSKDYQGVRTEDLASFSEWLESWGRLMYPRVVRVFEQGLKKIDKRAEVRIGKVPGVGKEWLSSIEWLRKKVRVLKKIGGGVRMCDNMKVS